MGELAKINFQEPPYRLVLEAKEDANLDPMAQEGGLLSEELARPNPMFEFTLPAPSYDEGVGPIGSNYAVRTFSKSYISDE